MEDLQRQQAITLLDRAHADMTNCITGLRDANDLRAVAEALLGVVRRTNEALHAALTVLDAPGYSVRAN